MLILPHAAFTKARFSLVLCIYNESEYMKSLDRKRLRTGISVIACSSSHKGVWHKEKQCLQTEFCPLNSFTFEVFQHKMDLARQRQDLGVKHCTRKAYLLLPLFLNFTTEMNRSVNWWLLSSSVMGRAPQSSPCFTHDIWPWCGVNDSLQSHDCQSCCVLHIRVDQ